MVKPIKTCGIRQHTANQSRKTMGGLNFDAQESATNGVTCARPALNLLQLSMSPNTDSPNSPKLESGKSIFEEEEDDPPLPESIQKSLADLEELPTLVLISLGKAPPLGPPPQLAFDLRSLSNPPKHIRDAHNGTSKRLQEWLSHDTGFLAHRETIQGEIEQAMVAYAEGRERLNEHPFADTQGEKSKQLTVADNDEDSLPAEEERSRTDDVEIKSSLDETRSPSAEPGYQLRVGINCQMGRHRSVAMVEFLSKLPWPGWQVRVEHRDIHKKRGKWHKTGGRCGRDSPSGEASKYVEEDWG